MMFAVIAVFAVFGQPATATVLFRDDFSGSALNQTDWSVANYTFGGNRAYFGNTPAVANGMATLKLDTYNADHPGSFRGTEIITKQAFDRGTTGIQLEARVRTNMTHPGAVTSFFTYTQVPPTNYSDEIDFEYLTNQIHSTPTDQKVLTTSWHNWGAPGSNYNDQIHHHDSNPVVTGLDMTQFNTFDIRWLPDRTEWYVNGVLISSWKDTVPTAAMSLHMNFWPPDSSWAAAYDLSLQPAATATANQSYTYDVDYVQVSTVVPEPTSFMVLTLAAFGFAVARRTNWRKGSTISIV